MPEQTLTQPQALNRVAEVKLDLTVELGRVRVPLGTLLNWAEGSLLELNKAPGSPVTVRVNGDPFATGEVVTIDERFGVRLRELRRGPAEEQGSRGEDLHRVGS